MSRSANVSGGFVLLLLLHLGGCAPARHPVTATRDGVGAITPPHTQAAATQPIALDAWGHPAPTDNFSPSLPPPKPDPAYQRILDTTDWEFNQQECSPFYCISQLPENVGIRMTAAPGAPQKLLFEVLVGDKAIYSWEGHEHSVFTATEARFYYVDFNPASEVSNGDGLVAVDLKTGKVLWKARIEGIQSSGHFFYSSRVLLAAGNEHASIRGEESFGRWMEIKEMRTGKTIAHRVFKDDPAPRN